MSPPSSQPPSDSTVDSNFSRTSTFAGRWIHRWRSTKIISVTSRRAPRRWKSSIISRACCRYRTSSESRAGTPHDTRACCVPYKLPHPAQVVVQVLLSRHELRGHSAASTPVSGHRRPSSFRVSNPLTCILQASVRRMKIPTVFKILHGLLHVHEGNVEIFPRVLQHTSHAFLALLGFVELFHSSAHMSPSEFPTSKFALAFSNAAKTVSRLLRACIVFWLRSYTFALASVFFLKVWLKLPFLVAQGLL